jgi:hypothetical protein
MTQNTLNFKLTESKGNYGIIFNNGEAIAFAMFNDEDHSLSVAFKKGKRNNYIKSDIMLSVFDATNNLYGMHDYSVIENNTIFNAHAKKFKELNN